MKESCFLAFLASWGADLRFNDDWRGLRLKAWNSGLKSLFPGWWLEYIKIPPAQAGGFKNFYFKFFNFSARLVSFAFSSK